MSKGVQIAIGAVTIALLIGWFGWSQVEGGSFVYYQTLEEFRAAGATDRPSRVHGYVTEGSIERDVPGKVVRFLVQSEAPHAGGSAEGAMPVVFASLETPDLFKDGAEVVVEGRLMPAGDFHASNVLAKCPSKFEGETPEDGAGTAPRAASF